MNTRIDLSRFYLLEKGKLARTFIFLGCLLAYLCSIHPWFLWPLEGIYVIPVALLLISAVLLSNTMEEPIFRDSGYFTPLMVYVMVSFYMCWSIGMTLSRLISVIFSIIIFYVLLRIQPKDFDWLLTLICKSMAVLLGVSVFFFLLHLVGFPLPSRQSTFGEQQYNFDNYFFFMIANDREMINIIPRFSSVFLEPGHLGTAASLLIMTQMGRWNRWYNIVLWFATVLTFSLAAYAFLTALIFFNLWVQRKRVVGKAILAIVFIASVVGASFVYNGGDNLFHDLILLRLEVDDRTGEMTGNNRVSEDFQMTYDKYISTPDVILGRSFAEEDIGYGNSGYRVFVFEHGLVGTLLTFIFYFLVFRQFRDPRCLIAAVVIALLNFWIRGYPWWYSNILPFMALIYTDRFLPLKESGLLINQEVSDE